MTSDSDAPKDPIEIALTTERSTASSLALLGVLAALFSLLAFGAPVRPFYLADQSVIWISGGLAVLLLLASYVDIKIFILPDLITIPLIPLGVVFHAQYTGLWIDSLIGVVLGGGLFLAVFFGARQILQKDGLGLGDVKLIMVGGAFGTAWAIPLILMCAAASALIIVLGVWLIRRGGSLTAIPIPFGPFLALGIWTAWCYPGLYLG